MRSKAGESLDASVATRACLQVVGPEPGLKQSRGISGIFVLELMMAFLLLSVSHVSSGTFFSFKFLSGKHSGKTSIFCPSYFGVAANTKTGSLKNATPCLHRVR